VCESQGGGEQPESGRPNYEIIHSFLTPGPLVLGFLIWAFFAAIRGQHGGINCKKDRQAGSRSLPGTATGLSNDLRSMHSRFSEATTPHAMMRANSKRRAA
jgi:hypothetical protein